MLDRTNASPSMATSSVTMPVATPHPRGPLAVKATVQGLWEISELDPERALADLGHRFPNTGRYWALARGADGWRRQIEAATAGELSRLLDSLGPLSAHAHPYGAEPRGGVRLAGHPDATQTGRGVCVRNSVRRRPICRTQRRSAAPVHDRSGQC